MSQAHRPLSPHLQVYRPQLTSVLSILHRGTGVALSVGAIALVAWLVCIASGVDTYSQAQGVFAAGWFRLLIAGWAFCGFYHLGNGIRHLAWDVGWGFELSQAYASGWTVVAFSVVATGAFLALAFL
jgi:succinate dehydrogenase / fumarate reductase cytochrome b subunit